MLTSPDARHIRSRTTSRPGQDHHRAGRPRMRQPGERGQADRLSTLSTSPELPKNVLNSAADIHRRPAGGDEDKNGRRASRHPLVDEDRDHDRGGQDHQATAIRKMAELTKT